VTLRKDLTGGNRRQCQVCVISRTRHLYANIGGIGSLDEFRARVPAMLSIWLGCGLRRRELIDLTFEHIQRRDEHWAIVDLH
jgi:integrase